MINQVTLVGRLTKDPELRVTTEGTPVTHVTLAVNRQYRNQNGQIEADFVQCTLWRKTAENTARYCRKGSVIGITGRIQTRHYENSERRRVYVTEVVAESVQFLGRKQDEFNPVSAAEPAMAASKPAVVASQGTVPVAGQGIAASQGVERVQGQGIASAEDAARMPTPAMVAASAQETVTTSSSVSPPEQVPPGALPLRETILPDSLPF